MADQPSGVVPAPPGVTLDFDYSHPWLYNANMTLTGIGLVVSTASLLLRVYTRVHILRKFEMDDVSIILAWAFSVITQSMCIYGYKDGGVGIHMWNVTPEMFDIYQKIVLVAAIVYVPALAFAKVSLIVLYHRIMSRTTLYKWALYILSAIVCGYSIALVLALIFACNPIAKSWDVSITSGSCIDRNGVYIATAVTNIITDLALILLPVPVVITLQMPRIQKIGLLVLFTIGCATFVTSIVRLVTLIDFQKSQDITYGMGWPQLWINIEANLIIICPSLPFLRQFLRHHSPRWIGDSSGSGHLFSRDYLASSFGRSRRQHGAFQLQDEVALTDNGSSMGHNDSHIVKEVQWHVTEERVGVPGAKAPAEM